MRVMGRRHWVTAWAGAMLTFAPLGHAQKPHLTAREVGQIANESLRVIVPPDSTLSGIAVSRRGVAFDVRESLAAFGAPMSGDTAVRFDRAVDVVSRGVLSDCSQMMPQPCAGLGSRVYVSIEPLSVTSAQAHVRVNVLWPTRGYASRDRAYLTGFSATIHLVRDGSGAWVFQKQDRSVLVM